MELGLVIGKGGRDIPQDAAESHIAGYGGQDSDQAERVMLTRHLHLSFGGRLDCT